MLVMCSADCHLMEPPNLWAEGLPKAMRSRAPRYEYTDTHRIWHTEGRAIIKEPLQIQGRADRTPITEDIELRLKELHEDGIWAEMIFGNMATQCLGMADGEFALACARVYNTYLAEAYGPYGERELPVAMIPIGDIDAAITEIERVAGLGLRTIGLPMTPPRPYFLDDYDKVWAAAQAHGLPISFHAGTGVSNPILLASPSGPEAAASPRFADVTATSFDVFMSVAPQTLVATMIGSGALERYPELTIIVVEAGAGWLGRLMMSMDFSWMPKVGHDREAPVTLYNDRGEEMAPNLQKFKQGGWPYPLSPSDYARRQVKVTFMDEPAPLEFLHVTGPEPLLWGSDFPHSESTWPRSREVTDALFARVDPADKAAILGGNFAKLYGLELPSSI